MTTLLKLPPLETPRLVVRELEMRDADDFTTYMTRTDYQRHIAVKHATAQSVRNHVLRTVSRQSQKVRNAYVFAGELKQGGTVVADGFVLCHGHLGELGWGVNPDFWRRGFGLELGRALVAQAFERLECERVWCKVMGANAASRRLAHRLGMKSIKSHSDFPVGGGRVQKVEFFALTLREYFEAAY
jgi:[ribosomal protein S5]-alanine N-acetyltransferase